MRRYWVVGAIVLAFSLGYYWAQIRAARIIANLVVQHHKERRPLNGWTVLDKVCGPITRNYTQEELRRSGLSEDE